MFIVNEDLSIYVTRGDIAFFNVTATSEGGTAYKFQPGEVVRMKVFGKKDAENVVMQKDFPVTAETDVVQILLTEEDTKIGDVISKPTDYWYEVELNPFDNPQTIIGYDEDGAKVFKLFPEGRDLLPSAPNKEDISVMDSELSLTSTNPVQNQAITRKFVSIDDIIQTNNQKVTARVENAETKVTNMNTDVSVLKSRVNNIATLGAGSTTADAELVDIRIGGDGKTYSSAGEAVREQIANTQEDIEYLQRVIDVGFLNDFKAYKPTANKTALTNGFVEYQGRKETIVGYSSVYTFPEDFVVYGVKIPLKNVGENYINWIVCALQEAGKYVESAYIFNFKDSVSIAPGVEREFIHLFSTPIIVPKNKKLEFTIYGKYDDENLGLVAIAAYEGKSDYSHRIIYNIPTAGDSVRPTDDKALYFEVLTTDVPDYIKLGQIEDALDLIIGMQNQLIGGGTV